MYKEIIKEKLYQNNVEFEPITHSYLYGGRLVPSVTTLMKALSENTYKNIPEHVLNKAGERGTKIHKIIELWETEGIEPTEYQEYLLQYKKAKKLEGFEVLFMEVAIGTEEFAGTLDIIGLLNGKLIIIDLKITSKINTDLLEVQLAGYDELCKYVGIDIIEHYVLHLTKTGYKFKPIKLNIPLWESLK